MMDQFAHLLSKQEENAILLARIDERTTQINEKVDALKKELANKLRPVQKRLMILERWRWITIGALATGGSIGAKALWPF